MFGEAPKKPSLQERVESAAEQALRFQGSVSPIELFNLMGLLSMNCVDRWRHGGVSSLDELMQGGRERVERSFQLFREWAKRRGLQAMQGRYVRASREGDVELRFTGEKYAGLEDQFRTHYVSPEISERKRRNVVEREARPAERVVYWNLRDSACSECGSELPSGSFLFLDAGQPLCLACANLGELEFLPSGDTALTRRATKYAGVKVVVVRFSRSRKRYERQGILVPDEALRKAEEECAGDAAERAAAREHAAVGRKREDAVFVEDMTAKIRKLFPGCPEGEARRIAAHTSVRGSGRVGRSAAGRQLDQKAVTLAVWAALRHNRTEYDALLAQGVERETARARVRGKIENILELWKG